MHETVVSVTARTFLVTIYLKIIYNEMKMTAPSQSTGAQKSMVGGEGRHSYL